MMPPSPDGASGALRAALRDAAALLPLLSRRRADVADARTRVAALAAAHPAVQVDLAVDLRPGSNDADYDLLLGDASGTLALSFRPERGNPWVVDYAEHWAANLVLSAGPLHVTVQQALGALHIAGDESPRLLEHLVDQLLLERAMDVDPPPVTAAEVQAAVDAIRAARGLHSAEATHAWLRAAGWTPDTLRTLAENGLRARKAAERIVAAEVEPWFAAHAAEFDTVRWARASVPDEATCARLFGLARTHGVVRAANRLSHDPECAAVQLVMDASRAHALDPRLGTAAAGSIVGPSHDGGRHWIGEVLSRTPATLDARTRGEVTDVLIRRWLDAERATLPIRWHWT